MLHYALGPAQHSPRGAPIAARIPSSDAGERGPRANAECGNWYLIDDNVSIEGRELSRWWTENCVVNSHLISNPTFLNFPTWQSLNWWNIQ